MQLVKFDSAEVEARQEKLREYAYKTNKAVQELDSDLLSLIFDTQKVIDKLCFHSPVRSSDDGALGMINYVLDHIPQQIDYIDRTHKRVTDTFNYWKGIVEALNREIKPYEQQISDLYKKLAALPPATSYDYIDEDGEWRTEWIDPFEDEKERLSNEIDRISEYLEPIRSRRNIASNNCSIAQKDIDKLNSFLARCNSILTTANKDSTHIDKALKSLREIIESLNKYRAKLNDFNNSVMELIEKAQKIFGKALSAITELKAVSHNYISDFKNAPIKVKFDIDDCKKYKVNGDEFSEEIGKLCKHLVGIADNLSEWNDSNKSEAYTTILSHAEAMNAIIKYFDNEMDFLKIQVSILTDYYNAIS